MDEAQLEYLAFARSRQAHLNGIVTVVEGESVGQMCVRHLKMVATGIEEEEYKILAAFTCLPSIMCDIVPVIQLYGEPGSGKSQLLLAVSNLSGQKLISGQSTGASFKNHINQIRWYDSSTMTTERDCLLLVDNVNSSTFDSDEALGAFLNGYNRATDIQFISGGKGLNIEFRTFCPKLFTSVWDVESKELRRRMLVIKTTKVHLLDDLVYVNDINWSVAATQLKSFWVQQEHHSNFDQINKAIKSAKKPLHGREYWTLVADLMTTGVVAGVWDSVQSAIDDLTKFGVSSTKKKHTLLDNCILEALHINTGIAPSDWKKYSDIDAELIVQPRAVQEAIDEYVKQSLIERPRLRLLQATLKELGWSPAKKDGKIVYRYLSKINPG